MVVVTFILTLRIFVVPEGAGVQVQDADLGRAGRGVELE
jgi:hypothetical protein